MPFGRYRGRPLHELPDSYIDWLLDDAEVKSEALKRAVREERAARKARNARTERVMEQLSTCPSPDLAVEIVEKGWRSASKRVHPDGGGTHDEMLKLTETRDWLQKLIRALPRK